MPSFGMEQNNKLSIKRRRELDLYIFCGNHSSRITLLRLFTPRVGGGVPIS